MRTLLGLAASAVILASVTTPAGADQLWQQSTSVWKTMDLCTRAARKAFPDYTAEANAKREAFRRSCLRSNNLPVNDEPQPAAPKR